ncbi:hypothetical protein HXX01_00385 [Candidatus Nomurabacteria bacterium]|nr:hypothetical protein [Candidatus Nomurabacteria bacterium]
MNDTKNAVTMTSPQGEVVLLAQSQSVKITKDLSVIYLMTLCNDDSTATVVRNGFVQVDSAKDTAFVSSLKPILCYLKNNTFEEISVDYGKYTVFIPSGETRKLNDILLSQSQTCSLVIRDFIAGQFGKPEVKELSFKYKNGRMLAEK